MGNVALVAFASLFLDWLAVRHFQLNSRLRLALWLSVILKIVFVGFSLYFFPQKIFYKDAARYFLEIQGIVQQPWRWNVFGATGSWGYDVSNKMGMSYLYGVVAHIFNASPVLTIFTLNIVLSSLTALVGMLITRMIAATKRYDFWVFVLISLHPEVFFWVSRIMRENVATFLVTMLIYLSMRTLRGASLQGRLCSVAALLVILVVTYLTRVQLILALPLFLLSYGMIRALKTLGKRPWLFLMFGGVFALALSNLGLIRQYSMSLNILTGEMTEFFTISAREFEGMLYQLSNVLPKVMTLFPSAFGALGIAMIPFSLFTFGGVLLALFQGLFEPKRMDHDMVNAIVLTTFIFFVGLAIMEIYTEVPFGVRFRTPVIPLLVCIAVPSIGLFLQDLSSLASVKKLKS